MKQILSDMAATPFVMPACVLALGILSGRYFDCRLPVYIAAGGLLLGVVLSLYPFFIKDKAKRLSLQYKCQNSVWLIVLPMFFIAGNILLRNTQTAPANIENYPYNTAIVRDVLYTTSGDVLTVEITRLANDTGTAVSITPVKALLHTAATVVKPGDIIRYRANLRRVEQSSQYAVRLYAYGVDYQSNVLVGTIEIIGSSDDLTTRATGLRDRLSLFVEDTSLSRETKSFINALILGDRSELSAILKADFADIGLSHILSLSGLHVGIILMILGWILLPLNLCGLYNLRWILMAVGIALFAVVVGLGATVVRAVIMGLCLIGAKLLQRPHSAVNALSVAACVILLFTPRALFGIGFQLSFLCSIAIVVAVREINIKVKQGTLKNKLLIAIAVPAVCMLVSWPLLAVCFRSLPLISLPVNLLIVPLLPAFIFFVLVFLLTTGLGMDIVWLRDALDSAYSLLAGGVHTIAAYTDPFQTSPLPKMAVGLAIVAALGLLYTVCRASMSRKCFTAGAYTALLVSLIYMPAEASEAITAIPTDYYGLSVYTRINGKTKSVALKDGSVSYIEVQGESGIYIDTEVDILPDVPEKEHILIIGKNFKGDIEALIARIHPRCVVLSARAYSNIQDEISAKCNELKVPCHSLRESAYEWRKLP
ncbi:MAG: ComEC/Rec2 family competence protein [Prevotella sp.]|nr:ComEC/Rec2 family competence protein [Prevotella sp.]MCM1075566.1 ComEC/Rec2 family competence protein [Ruminococcus sp.]